MPLNFLYVSSMGLRISVTEKGVVCFGLSDMVQKSEAGMRVVEPLGRVVLARVDVRERSQ